MWTTEAVQLLMVLWAQGLSAEEIANQLAIKLQFKTTRNAVIGKAHRLNSPPRLARRNPRPRQPHKSHTPPPPSIAKPRKPKTLLELNANECRWPVTEGRPWLFCGAQANNDNHHYCSKHGAMAWQRKAKSR